jgi:DMSO/TMAO reductase YedYZ molybdopterin-dependent catalytic subunit
MVATEERLIEPAPTPRRGSAAAAGLAGLLAAGVALSVGELIAGLSSSLTSPLVAVGNRVIENVPRSVKDFAIQRFGTNDKVALVAGIVALTAVFGILIGLVARRHFLVGAAGVAAFGIVGGAAAMTDADTSCLAFAPSLFGAAAGIVALGFLITALTGRRAPTVPAPLAEPDSPLLGRRAFVVGGAAVAALAAGSATLGRYLQGRFSAAASRAGVILPRALRTGTTPAGADLAQPGITPLYTPNREFYRIDINLVVPQIPAETWTLRVHGMVDNEIELTFAQLLERPLIEEDITLVCVSNEVGGRLAGNARWLGAPLRDLLVEAGVRPDADQVVGRSSDGFTTGFPFADAMDGRPALVAVGMNGEPLPLEHGFPARLVVPGLYGYVSATKWLTEIELTRFDRFDQYWVKREWSERAPIKLFSRIDTPRALARIAPGPTAIGGVAWSPTIGVEQVEVRIDGGPWQPARLGTAINERTWRQWVYPWEAAPGRHVLEVRATDRTGVVQPEERVAPFPNGATGWHSVVVTVAP